MLLLCLCFLCLVQNALSMLDGEVHWYMPSIEDIERYGDGGIAIIDQWILSHAK